MFSRLIQCLKNIVWKRWNYGCSEFFFPVILHFLRPHFFPSCFWLKGVSSLYICWSLHSRLYPHLLFPLRSSSERPRNHRAIKGYQAVGNVFICTVLAWHLSSSRARARFLCVCVRARLCACVCVCVWWETDSQPSRLPSRSAFKLSLCFIAARTRVCVYARVHVCLGSRGPSISVKMAHYC